MAGTQFVFDAIGTHWVIDVSEGKELTEGKIKARIEDFDKKYSRFRADSLVTQMAQKPGTYILPPDSKQLFDLYHKLYTLTDGYMTPLVGTLLSDAGYDKDYSFEEKPLTEVPAWEDTLLYKFPDLMVRKHVLMDVGACGKGYLIDLIGEMLEKEGITEYCIDAGGDIRYRNTNDEILRVGLEHPDDTSQAIGVVELRNKSICGSAGNRRVWGRFHHIMNPKTRESVENIKAVWVVADTTLLADGLSTALFFTKAETLQKEFDFEYVLLFPDYTIEKSENFPGELFFK
jgi:thiamine biosynthesis lipoprotein